MAQMDTMAGPTITIQTTLTTTLSMALSAIKFKQTTIHGDLLQYKTDGTRVIKKNNSIVNLKIHPPGLITLKFLAGSPMNGFLSSPEMSSIRRPAKLEALPREATTKALKALKINNNDF